MRSNYLLFALTAFLLIMCTSCNGSGKPTANDPTLPVMETETPQATATEPQQATATESPQATITESILVTATETQVQTEWLFQVTVTMEQLGPVGAFNWGILETRTPIKEDINPVPVSALAIDVSGQMCARGELVEGQPMVTSLTSGACIVEIPVP